MKTYCCIAGTVLGVFIAHYIIIKYLDPPKEPAKFEYICTRNGAEYIKTPEGGLDLSVDAEGVPVSCEPVPEEVSI